MKNKRLLQSIGNIDEKYIEEAEPKMKNSQGVKRILGIAACFAIVVCLGLYLFLPFGSGTANLSAYRDSQYFPLIETIEDYRYVPPKYNNNFEALVATIGSIGSLKGGAPMDGDSLAGSAPGNNADMDMAPGDAGESMDGANGKYEEVTDNQVEGVIEADIFKRTDEYIFRITNNTLTVYSIAGEESEKISSTEIPFLDNEYAHSITNMEMYLSADGKTITLIKEYSNKQKVGEVGIISFDVSDVSNIKVNGTVSIEGSYNTSRMVDGRLLLVTEYYFNAKTADYSKPETYVPSVTRGDSKECIEFEDIIFPENIKHTRYSVVALIGEEDLDVLGATALLNFTDTVYVSRENVYLARSYAEDVPINVGEGHYVQTSMSDIAVLGYSGESLVKKGIITAEGTLKDQYSLDEKDGYLRIVTSTSRINRINYNDYRYTDAISAVSGETRRSASLYVFKLEDNSLVASVKNFAPEGERAESVRFDGDTLYVCTAIVIEMTDPVFFFDLSDYSNITYTDTGNIEGYSTSLINLGEGFLLGIGREDWQYNKVEVWEEKDDEKVVSVDSFLFSGWYSEEYKSYLVNRDENLFGFAVKGYYTDNDYKSYRDAYILLCFNGYELVVLDVTNIDFTSPERVRAAYVDGYIYITSDDDFKVVNLNK